MGTATSAQCSLKLTDITKTINNNIVLDQISFSIHYGEVCCIMGENGAGKSTLMKIISGQTSPDTGSIVIGSQCLSHLTPAQAHSHGIHIVSQHPELFSWLSIEDNIFAGREICKKYWPFINHHAQRQRIQEIFEIIGITLDPTTLVDSLTYSEKRMVDLARALAFGSRILIFDEFSEMADSINKATIHRLIQRLKNIGISILYITHNLKECMEISDRLIIMKNGRILHDYDDISSISPTEIISQIAGDVKLNRYPKTNTPRKDIPFQTQQLSCQAIGLYNINLQIHSGEITGVIGLEDSGLDQLFQLLTGAVTPSSGSILLYGSPVVFHDPSDAARHGISFLNSSDNHNLFDDMDSYYNTSISNLDRVAERGFIFPHNVSEITSDYLYQLGLPHRVMKQEALTLSTGEKHKLAISKMLFSNTRIFIMNNPAANLDIPSRIELYNLINHLSHQNFAILILSTDAEEIIGMCDCMYLMRNKQIVMKLHNHNQNISDIIAYLSET